MEAKKQGLSWFKTGTEYKQLSGSFEITDVLPRAVYMLKMNPLSKELYLEKMDEEFSFNMKIYGLEDAFIKHVLYTYEHTDKNLGILLNGQKGTGKTVCAKILANSMNLPIIICDTPYDNLATFIAQFNTSAVFFFDEFEKNFKDCSEILLSAMDGAYNTMHRKIFLMTTNNLYIDKNFLSRPSRVRYKKTFGNLSQEVVKEYCDENLNNKVFLNDIISYIDSLSISTIDILKGIVDEVNLHNCSPEVFKDFFNVETAPYHYNVVQVYANNLYTIEEFKSDVEKYREGEELEDETSKRDSLSNNRISCTMPIFSLKEGDSLNENTILKPIDENNIIICQARYGYDTPFVFYKVLNIGFKPSLYNKQTLLF